MTVKSTIGACRAFGMNCRYKDGEYRVNYPNGTESTAYYTSDALDAMHTARNMLNQRRRQNGLSGNGLFGSGLRGK